MESAAARRRTQGRRTTAAAASSRVEETQPQVELSDEQEPQLLHTPSVAIPVREGIEFLPLVVPTTRVMEFTNLGEGWPPRPRNQTDVQSFEATELAGTLSVDVELRIRA